MPKRKREVSVPDLRALMRIHRITIRRLAAHIGAHEVYVASAFKGRHCVAKGKYRVHSPAFIERMRVGVFELVSEATTK